MESWHYLLMILGAITLIVIIYFVIKNLVKEIIKVRHLNLKKKGYTEMPAVPFILTETIATILKLGLRVEENKMAKNGLSNMYTINDETHSGYTFMYDKASHDPGKTERETLLKRLGDLKEEELLDNTKLDRLFNVAAQPGNTKLDQNLTESFLEHTDQFTMSWTNYYGIYQDSLPKANEYASALTDADAATEQFWPMIANNGFAYNLLFLQKVREEQIEEIKTDFGNTWNDIISCTCFK